MLESYEDTFFPNALLKAGKSIYIQRNYYMIDNSSYCIFYYNKDYSPKITKFSNKGLTGVYTSNKSGTKIAFDYAKSKKKVFYNLS